MSNSDIIALASVKIDADASDDVDQSGSSKSTEVPTTSSATKRPLKVEVSVDEPAGKRIRVDMSPSTVDPKLLMTKGPVTSYDLWVSCLKILHPSFPTDFATLSRAWRQLPRWLKDEWTAKSREREATVRAESSQPVGQSIGETARLQNLETAAKISPTELNDTLMSRLVEEMFQVMQVAELRRMSGYKLFQLIKLNIPRCKLVWSTLGDVLTTAYMQWALIISDRAERLVTEQEAKEYNSTLPAFSRSASDGLNNDICHVLTDDDEVLSFVKADVSASSSNGGSFELVFDKNYDCLGFYDFSKFDPKSLGHAPFFPK